MGNLFDYDGAILLAERAGQADPDGATTLGVLKLLEVWAEGRHRLRRIVAELMDPDKATLLRERVQWLGPQPPFAFVCTSRLRQNILAHSFFVPGLPPVLHNLITAGEQELYGFEPTTTEGGVTWRELVTRLTQEGQIPLALVRTDGTLTANPVPETRFEWGEVSTIYCLGTAERGHD